MNGLWKFVVDLLRAKEGIEGKEESNRFEKLKINAA
jgi:hypothetical protein